MSLLPLKILSQIIPCIERDFLFRVQQVSLVRWKESQKCIHSKSRSRDWFRALFGENAKEKIRTERNSLQFVAN